MPSPLASLALAALLAFSADSGEAPRAVVAAATRAVWGDSAAAVRSRWTARLARDPADRAAALALATLARLAYDYDDAARRYRALLADSARPDGYAVYARLGLAEGMEAQGRVKGLLELLSRARSDARALGDRAAEGTALYWRGHVAAPHLGATAALADLDSALAALPPDARDVEAYARCRRAHILVVTRRPAAAGALRAATDAVRRSGAPPSEAYCLRARLHDFEFRGEMDSVLAVSHRLEELYRRARDRSGLAFALALRGDRLRNQGSYGDVLEIFRRAEVEARASRNLYVEGILHLGVGAIALALNDHPTAAERVERAIGAMEAMDNAPGAWQARHFRSLVSLSAGDHARARREIGEVLAWERRTESWYNMVGLYQQLAHAGIGEGDWTAAAEALDSARAVARRGGVEAPSLDFDEARLALRRGDLARAERLLGAYLTTLDSSQRLSRYEARARLAEVYARRGELARAERELTLATDEQDAWRARLSDPELRVLAFQASGLEHNDRHAGVPAVLATLARGGRPSAAFGLAERRRARDLADRMTRTRALHASGRASSSLGAETSLTGAFGALDIAALLPDDRSALLEFVTGRGGTPTTLLVLTRPRSAGDSVRAYTLASADSLVRQVARFTALVEGGEDPRPLARALGATLLDPALAALPPSVTRLVVVPDGPLHRVPWDALRLADGRHVVERFAVGVAPSAGVVAALWSAPRKAEATPPRILAFGDPAFPGERAARNARSEPDDAETYRSAFDSAGGLPRLEASAREARLVARFAPASEVRLREGASAAYLKRTPLTPFRVLHLATHALVDERSVARTALALAPGAGESGFVGAADLAALALDADLVVLSACRSAGGVVLDGEGIQGLTAPLLEAGARAVVATGWRIGDRSTVAFMEDFYGALARGLPVVEALRAAKLAAIERGAPAAEWAAFTAVGDPFVIVALRQPPRAWWRGAWGWAALLGVALLTAIVARAAGNRQAWRG